MRQYRILHWFVFFLTLISCQQSLALVAKNNIQNLNTTNSIKNFKEDVGSQKKPFHLVESQQGKKNKELTKKTKKKEGETEKKVGASQGKDKRARELSSNYSPKASAENKIRDEFGDEIPAGFENITNDYNGPVKLYLYKESLGSVDVDYNERRDRIYLSTQAKKRLLEKVSSQLTDEGLKSLKNDLNQPLAAHSTLQAAYLARGLKHITVYFNMNELKLAVLVPPSFYSKKRVDYSHSQYHPDVSYKNPAMTNYIDYDVNQYRNDDPRQYWSLAGNVNSGKLSLQYSANSNLDNYFDDMYLKYLGKKYQYTAGYQDPLFQTPLVPTGNFWGVSMSESPKLINPKFYRAYQVPYYLVVNEPSYVEISYRGKILFRGTLQQGENAINTASFPAGSYPITITEQSVFSGVKTERTDIFSKDGAAYNWLYSGFAVVAGLRSQYFSTVYNDPISSDQLYFRVKNGFRALKGEVDLSYTFTDDTNYLGLSYDYLSTHAFDFSLGGSVDDLGEFFSTAGANYSYGRSRFQLNASHAYELNENNNQRRNSYGGTYVYSADSWRFNVNARYYGQQNTSISTALTKSMQLGVVPIRSYITYTKTNDQGYEIAVGTSVYFSKNTVDGSLGVLHNFADQQSAINATTRWSHDGYRLSQSTQVPISHKGQVTGSNSASSTIKAAVQAEVASLDTGINIVDNDEDGLTLANKNFGVSSSMILTPKGFTMTHHRTPTGFVVSLPYIDNNKPDKYIVDKKEYDEGRTIFVERSPFSHQKLSVTNPSDSHQLNNSFYKAFLYPNNIHHMSPILTRVCFADFKLITNDGEDNMYMIVDNKDDFFFSNEESSVMVPDGQPLNFILAGSEDESDICKTGINIKCGEEPLSLGNVYCQ